MKKKKTKTDVGYCGECFHAVHVTDFHTLALNGAPTLARCPFVRNRRVLLTERCVVNQFKPLQTANSIETL